jgi:hypothetical protein
MGIKKFILKKKGWNFKRRYKEEEVKISVQITSMVIIKLLIKEIQKP